MSSEQSKTIALGFINAVNSCDASQVVDYYTRYKDFEAYFANPHRRRRMNFGYINSEFDTKEEWLVLIREMWEFHNMVFPKFEYEVIKPWILCEGDRVLVPSQFNVIEPFRLKFSI